MCVGKAMGVVETPEKKMSLLKKHTNFDKIKDMSSWAFAGKMDEFIDGDCDICPFGVMKGDKQECLLLDYKPTTCRRKYYKWLESEAD
ncbi:MAG: hypothetical protein ACI4IR_06925 [Eubacterium sp.]